MKVDSLNIEIHKNRKLMGRAAALAVSEKINSLFLTKENIRMIFAAAPSQNELLENLVGMVGIDWSRITAFQMDEYIGLDGSAPQRFGNYLKEHIFGKVPFGRVHYLNPSADNPQAECERYAKLLQEAPIDIICMGIGENGHIAFNDPPVADFQDPLSVKVVDLDQICRQQQVNDGCFPALENVPRQAITLTVPTLFSGKNLFIVVPGPSKAKAVYHTINDAIGTHCPATILRMHPGAVLYLDYESACQLNIQTEEN